MKTSRVHLFLLLFVSAGSLVLSACGSGDGSAGPGTTIPTDDTLVESEALADDAVVLVWTETGGCAMAGPNCGRYEVLADGSVTAYRERETEPAASGTVDPSIVAEWVEMVEATDTSAMVDRLGPGELTAAFDGVDYFLDAPFAGFTLSSVDKEFDQGEPFFAAAADLARAAAEAAPIELMSR